MYKLFHKYFNSFVCHRSFYEVNIYTQIML